MMTYIKQEIPGWKTAIMVSPDAGGAKRYVFLFFVFSHVVHNLKVARWSEWRHKPLLKPYRATALADQLNLDFALINRKRRRDLTASFHGSLMQHIPTVPPTPAGSDSGSSHEDEEQVETMELLVGDVRGRVAILVDDMIDTGHTVRLAAQVLRENGASEVYALISHGEYFSLSLSLFPLPQGWNEGELVQDMTRRVVILLRAQWIDVYLPLTSYTGLHLEPQLIFRSFERNNHGEPQRSPGPKAYSHQLYRPDREDSGM